MKWLWLVGALLLAVFAFGVFRAAGNPAFWLGLLTTAVGAIFRFLVLHARDLSPEELERGRQGQFQYKRNDRDHTHEDHK